MRVYAAPDFLERMLDERRAQIVVMSGRNRQKIDRIVQCVRAGVHVLADKPWVIEEPDLPKLKEALNLAEAARVIVFDAMTQRFESTAIIQRALVADPDVFGARAGSPPRIASLPQMVRCPEGGLRTVDLHRNGRRLHSQLAMVDRTVCRRHRACPGLGPK